MWGVELEPARDAAPLDQAPQALAPARGLRASDQLRPLQSAPEQGQALYGLLAALAGLRLLDPQVAQQPVEGLLVGVVLLPAGEVIEAVAKPAGQL